MLSLTGPAGLPFIGLEGTAFALVLVGTSLVLMFAGKSAIKALAFLVVGISGAVLGLELGASYLGAVGEALGVVLGFLVGGVLGVVLVNVGMGIALAYFGYLAVLDFSRALLVAVAVGAVLFVAGIVMAAKILELLTAILGGLILYQVLPVLGLSLTYAAPLAGVLAVVGFYAQFTRHPREDGWRRI